VSDHGFAPYVGFDLVPFDIQPSTAGTYPDWEWSQATEIRHIPGSNTAVVQHMGNPPATITLGLTFTDVADYRRFMQKQGVTGTLTLLANFTSAVGTVEHKINTDYEHLDGVTLLGVRGTQILIGDEGVECQATFLRAMDPLTGLAAT
jgi:hypothetical protein